MAVKKRKGGSEEKGAISLDTIIGDVDKKYGGGLIRQGSAMPNETYLPTGIFTIDMAMLGGMPEGRFLLYYGWESSGKTLLSLKTIAAAQKKHPDKKVFFVDVEGTYDAEWAAKHGVDNEMLERFQPLSGEQAVDVITTVAQADDVSVIVIDSLAMLAPMKDLENSAEDVTVATQARLISKMYVKLKVLVNKQRSQGKNVTIIAINQFRINVGQFFGDNRTLPGGKSQHFSSDIKIEMKNKEIADKDTGVVAHNEHSFVVSKNKFGNSLRQAQFSMIRSENEQGLPIGFIDDADTVISFGKKHGLVTGKKPKWRIDGIDRDFVEQGDMKPWLYENLEEFELLKKKLIGIQRRAMGLPALPPDNYL